MGSHHFRCHRYSCWLRYLLLPLFGGTARLRVDVKSETNEHNAQRKQTLDAIWRKARVQIRAADLGPDHRRVGEDRQPGQSRSIVSHLIILVPHEPGHRGAIRRSSSSVDPVRQIPHHLGVALVHLIFIHHHDDGIFWIIQATAISGACSRETPACPY